MNDVVRWLFMEERRTAFTAILCRHGLSTQLLRLALSVFCVFRVELKINSELVLSLNCISRLAFVAEMQCVYSSN